MLKLIALLYDNPKFRITAAGTSSAYRTQEPGIGQGLQWEPEYYNLHLNFEQFINLTLHQHQSGVKYTDGTLVPLQKEATYLGTLLSDGVDNHRKICNRLLQTPLHVTDWNLFWDRAHTSVRWKIRDRFHFDKQGSVRTWIPSADTIWCGQSTCMSNEGS